MGIMPENRLDLIKRACKGKRVLDVGCAGEETPYGHPLWLHGHICEVASSVLGIDNDPRSVAQIRRAGYNVVRADAEDFDLGEHFEVIVAGELIEHLSNPGKFLASAARHLSKRGKLVLTTPNLHSAFLLKEKFFHSKDSEKHALGFTPGLLRNLLEYNGWKVEQMRLVAHEAVSSWRGKLSARLLPSLLQVTIFCIAVRNKSKRGA